ncbi:MAG: pyrroline-5-carboxylate reductase [Desulfovibrionaceae bacterium]|nr:pyrroline-5-carboxylate reductase [Desulfovibrionaceae bacterium]MDD4952868.1 pyrroline-5-carboxylate reductase [Desulfovibrionaceae bacterium]
MSSSIGFIGLGNMGSAIIKGLSGLGAEVHGFDLDRTKMDALAGQCGLAPADSPKDLTAKCEFVVLAVKPQHAAGVLEEIAPELNPGKCLVSIAAGIPLARLKDHSENRCPVVRVMPNTPALVNAGVFAVCLEDPHLSEGQKKFVLDLFRPLGRVHVLEEKFFDAYTALIGSGPAYVLYFMEALIEAGVSLGFARDLAADMVLALFAGTSRLAVKSKEHVSLLREMVTSPGGTTISGLAHMDRCALRAHVMDAVRKAWERSRELGK